MYLYQIVLCEENVYKYNNTNVCYCELLCLSL